MQPKLEKPWHDFTVHVPGSDHNSLQPLQLTTRQLFCFNIQIGSGVCFELLYAISTLYIFSNSEKGLSRVTYVTNFICSYCHLVVNMQKRKKPSWNIHMVWEFIPFELKQDTTDKDIAFFHALGSFEILLYIHSLSSFRLVEIKYIKYAFTCLYTHLFYCNLSEDSITIHIFLKISSYL